MRTMNRFEQPFRGASSLQEQINRAFHDVVGHAGEESNLTPWAPSVDIYETENELVVKADLPDVNPQNLDIRVENNVLTIRGTPSPRDHGKLASRFHLVERHDGTFVRHFQLPLNVDASMITAEYSNGLLALRVPRAALPQATVIQVKTISDDAPNTSGVVPRSEVRVALKPGAAPNGSSKTTRAGRSS